MVAPLKIGSWLVGAIPAEWEILPDHGVRRAGQRVFPSTVVVTEEKLPEGMDLQKYIANQIVVMQHVLPEPNIQGPDRFTFPEVDEAQRLAVKYKSKDGRSVVQMQIYTGSAGLVGIVTFTTVEEELSGVSGAFRTIGSGLRFGKGKDKL